MDSNTLCRVGLSYTTNCQAKGDKSKKMFVAPFLGFFLAVESLNFFFKECEISRLQFDLVKPKFQIIL